MSDEADLVKWIVGQGVSVMALASEPAPSVERVLFGSDRFDNNPLGEKALVFPVGDDEIAWAPHSRRIASRWGQAWALGQDQVGRDGMGTSGRALPVRRDPIEWLRRGRMGVVVVDWPMAARVLAGLTLEAADNLLAGLLTRRLHLPAPVVVVARPQGRLAA